MRIGFAGAAGFKKKIRKQQILLAFYDMLW